MAWRSWVAVGTGRNASSRPDRPVGTGSAGNGGAQVGDLVAQEGRLLVTELGGGGLHFGLQLAHELNGLGRRRGIAVGQQGGPLVAPHGRVLAHLGPAAARPGRPAAAGAPQTLEDVGDRLADGLGIDPVFLVVGDLHLAPALGDRDRLAHGVGDGAGAEAYQAVYVPGGTAPRLAEEGG